jgi:hypothetical protein
MGGDLTATSKPRKFSVGAQRKHALICSVLRPDGLGAPDHPARGERLRPIVCRPILNGLDRQLVRHLGNAGGDQRDQGAGSAIAPVTSPHTQIFGAAEGTTTLEFHRAASRHPDAPVHLNEASGGRDAGRRARTQSEGGPACWHRQPVLRGGGLICSELDAGQRGYLDGCLLGSTSKGQHLAALPKFIKIVSP